MKIAYVSIADPRDVHTWSGTTSQIATALERQGCEIEYIGPLLSRRTFPSRVRGFWYNRLRQRRYLADREPATLRYWAERVQSALAGKHFDLVLSPGSMPLAYLKTDLPMAYWSDATFAGMIDFNPSFTRLAARSVCDGNAAEQRALDQCGAAIFASEWAAETARKNYQVDPAKIHVVPFGANLTRAVSRDEALKMIDARPRDCCRLIFVGTDWQLKGGDLVVELAGELNRAGLRTELTVVGSAPADTRGRPEFVRFEGVLSKRDPAQAARLEELFARSHFLALASRAEAYGIVFAEAAAFGVPSLATNVGGIPTAVKDRVSGKLFARDQFVGASAREVLSAFNRYESYRELAISAREHYEQTVNWQVAGKRVKDILNAIIRA